MTLLEVLTALAIFLMAMVAFGDIVIRNGQVALDIQHQNLATRLCQSKMAEVASGLVPLASDGGEAFDEEPDYTWAVDAEQGQMNGVWNVTVTVTGPPDSTGQPVASSVMQMVLDPTIVGSTQDVTPVTSSASTGNSNSTGNTGSSSSSTPATTPAAASTPKAATAPAAATTPKASTPASTGTTKSPTGK